MVSFMMLFGCQATELNYENPLDVPAGEVPAIVFEPSASQIPLLSSSLINIFAVEVENVTGIRAEVTYDNNTLQVSDVARGDLFGQNSQNSLFFVNYIDTPGKIVIDYFYLGNSESKSISGTGKIASILFKGNAVGTSALEFSSQTELVDKDDIQIAIGLRGQGNIDVIQQ
tara:strand:- start:11 stop:523 length:513 start_codon:yes stop_codon:yes gene_type:complete